jgi:DNA-binding transcriptional regulator LsrR (DeoR family)
MQSIDDQRLLVKVARLYYEQDMIQSKIGKQLRISRQKVQRLLQQARDEEIVKIFVKPIMGIHSDLEAVLEKRFGLDEALVIETTAYDDQTTIARELGAGAAEYLLRVIKPHTKIVISNWSRAILGIINALKFSRFKAAGDILVIQGLSELVYPTTISVPADLTRGLARVLGGRAMLIPAPGIAANPVAHDTFCADPNVAHVLNQARMADMAFMGVGPIEIEPAPEWGDIVSIATLSDLVEKGAVGEINLRYFDKDGQPVTSNLDDRVVGLTLDEIEQIGLTVCVAGGAAKLKAIEGVLNGRLTDVLITDHVTAQHLLV